VEHTAYNLRAAIHPKTFIIDTVELRPLSLGHLMALETVHCPFLLPIEQNQNLTYGEMAIHYVTALFICGHDWEDNQLLLNDDDLWIKEFGKFSEHILEKAVRPNPNWNLHTRTKYFQDGYLNYFINSMPILDPVGDQPINEHNTSGMDWKTNVKTIFSTKFGYTESKIYNMSLTQLYYEWSSFAEINGMVKVRSGAEQKAKEAAFKTAEEFRRQMKELHAQKQQEAKEPC
jgi:hypothetical protein